MSNDDQFYDHNDDQQDQGYDQQDEAWQQYLPESQSSSVNIPVQQSQNQPEVVSAAAENQPEHEDYGGLVPRESRKERRRREAMEREAREQPQAAAAGTLEQSAEGDAGGAAEKGPRRSPFAIAASLFKRSKKAQEPLTESVSESPETSVPEQAEEVVITLPIMATIDPAGLAEYGLDPSTLEAMGLDPTTLPQFDPEFLTELGINPNIVIELVRRQYYPQSGNGTALTGAGRKINLRRAVHLARRWAPAAAATVGLTATGAIWFMASGSENPADSAAVTKNESGETAETSTAVTEASTPAESVVAAVEPPVEVARAAEPSVAPIDPPMEVAKAADSPPPAASEALPALAADSPPPGAPSLPTNPPADSPIQVAGNEPAGLPALPGGTPEGIPGIPAANEAPPLPTASAIPPAESAPPLPPGENSLPPVADAAPPAAPVDAGKETNALPPIAGLTAAAAGAGAKLATDGLKEAPPLAAAAKPGEMPALPGLPESGAKVEPPPLTGDLAKDESVASAKEPPGLPPLGNAPEPSIKPENAPSPAKNALAKGLAGLAAGIGGAKVANDLAKSGDKPASADLEKPVQPPAEPAKAADTPADLPGSIAVKDSPEAPVSAPEPPGLAKNDLPKMADKTPAASLAQESEPPSSLKNAGSASDAKLSAAGGKGRAGLPVAQADWPTIPNGKGRVLRSIATPARTGANSIAMAGATATGVGLGMAASNISNSNLNSGSQATVQPISSTDIAPIRHVVQSGENFWTISRDYYGSGRYYKALWSANRQKVAKIDQLHVGDSIRIPAMESLDKSLIDSSGIAGKKPAPDEKPEAVARSLDSRAVRTGNEIESVPTEAPARKKAAPASPESITPGEIISQPVGETSARSATGGGAGRRHRVQQGETLRSIARDFLGDARRSQEIVELNDDILDDSRTPIRPGQVLRMPADSTETDS